MCIVFSIIERVYWYLRVILLNMFVVKSLYVSFPRSSFLCIHFVIFLWEWDGDLLLRTPGHCHFHHYIHFLCDFTPCLIWVDNHFSLYIHCFAIILIIVYDSSHSLYPPSPCSFLTLIYSRFDISLASFLSISLSVCFSSLPRYCYHIHIGHL